ncbi:MAG: ArsR family transcriptional regulator [Desulfuromonadales bacterium GWC2_61_20]|nr:MAG: ArsR family transcriptional regulator [Desulfuromonadales bacterium GWC2_61_20]
MTEVPRITPQEARPRILSGEALLVCAYEDDAKFRLLRLQGAIPYSTFAASLSGIAKARELVFYCA